MVLDNPVVNHGDATAREVRMCVGLGHSTMSRPARVGKAQLARLRMRAELLFELRDLADRLLALELTVAGQYRDPRRIVAPILQALQTLDQDRDNVTLCDGSDLGGGGGFRGSGRFLLKYARIGVK
mgnify:CR=1 FL=1